MEVTPLTCPKCATSWKLIKAGTGPITCPHCKAPLDDGPIAATPATTTVATPAVSVPRAVPDGDEPGLQADYDDKMEPPARRATHPLLRMSLILLLLMTLTPIALVIVLLVVCTALMTRV
jgi:hypothetical protein